MRVLPAKDGDPVVAVSKFLRRVSKRGLDVLVRFRVAQPEPDVARKEEVKRVALHVGDEVNQTGKHDRGRYFGFICCRR